MGLKEVLKLKQVVKYCCKDGPNAARTLSDGQRVCFVDTYAISVLEGTFCEYQKFPEKPQPDEKNWGRCYLCTRKKV